MKMRFEIVNRNEEGFAHFLLLPTVEIIHELQDPYFGIWEYSLGITWLNLSIWMIIKA